MATLEMYYDFSCPYAYIASTLVEDVVARHDATLVWRPVLLGALLKANDVPNVPVIGMPAAKARHQALDVLRWAEYHGVALTIPRDHPIRTVDALRLVLLASESDRAPLTHALYRAYWVEGRRVDDPAVLLDVAKAVGLDAADLVERIGDPDVKLTLRHATDEAIRRGVFGVPTFFVGDQMFWGQDRLHFVERALDGDEIPNLSDLPRYNLFASSPG